MNRRTRKTWAGFALGAALGLVGLTLLTWRALDAESEYAGAALEAQWEEDLRTALYRMDQRFAPLLARAVARTEGQGLAAEDSTYSVQLPDGIAVRQLDFDVNIAQISLANDAWINGSPKLQAIPGADNTRGAGLQSLQSRGRSRSQEEFGNRYGSNTLQTDRGNVNFDPKEPIEVGPLVPAWEGEAQQRRLSFARVVSEGEQLGNQTFYFQWDPLSALLIEEVADLFPEARLEPAEVAIAPEEDVADRLGSLPARLLVDPLGPNAHADSGLRATLVAAWLLGLAALAGFGLALRSGLADAARQRRFTRAVTHELRTPLTTFRMYSEMLAADMVPEERRHEYLHALENESGRLGALVENVLAHAQLEERSKAPARESLVLEGVVARHLPALERRSVLAGTQLTVALGDAGPLRASTDAERVGQILNNLVDNACKYGAPPEGHHVGAPIRIEGRCEERYLALIVRDSGAGIPVDKRAAIFRPFDRAGREESDPAPGVGLGLALCKDLAQALGGSLELEPPDGAGCAFALRLPRG